jgi:capsular exopolysaccharide synthesis family protein
MVAALVVGVGVGLSAIALVPRDTTEEETYQGTALLLVTRDRDTPGLSLDAMARLVEIDAVAERVADALGVEGEPAALTERVEATTDAQASTLSITATAPTPREAERLADGFADGVVGYLVDRKAEEAAERIASLTEDIDRTSRQIAEIDRQIDEGDTTSTTEAERNALIFAYGVLQQQYATAVTAAEQSDLEIIQDATATLRSATSLGPARSPFVLMAVAILLCLLGGVVIAIVIERVQTPIRTKQDAEKHFGVPVLAEVPPMSQRQRESTAIVAGPWSAPAEAFRLLEAGLGRSHSMNGHEGGARVAKARSLPPRTLLVTSASPLEGKTTVVANLAAAYAEQGKRVVVLSCDFRRPRIHQLLGTPNEHGLSEALRSGDGVSALRNYGVESAVRGVVVVPSGPPPENPGELLHSDGMRRLLASSLQHADVVLIDTAPILGVADAAHLVSEVDAVLLVARSGRTRVSSAERTIELMKMLRAPVAGVVLNGSRTPLPARYYRSSAPPAPAAPTPPAVEGSVGREAEEVDETDPHAPDEKSNGGAASRASRSGAMRGES